MSISHRIEQGMLNYVMQMDCTNTPVGLSALHIRILLGKRGLCSDASYDPVTKIGTTTFWHDLNEPTDIQQCVKQIEETGARVIFLIQIHKGAFNSFFPLKKPEPWYKQSKGAVIALALFLCGVFAGIAAMGLAK